MIEVEQQRGDDSICQVVGKLQVIGNGLFFVALSEFFHRGAARSGVERQVNRVFESGSFLHQPVRKDLEGAVLRIDGCFIVQRTVFKVKNEFRSDVVAVVVLQQVTCGKNVMIEIAECQEAMHKALSMADRHRVSGCSPQNNRQAQKNERPHDSSCTRIKALTRRAKAVGPATRLASSRVSAGRPNFLALERTLASAKG